jgi:DNA-binding CsgD family transcriptional regulator
MARAENRDQISLSIAILLRTIHAAGGDADAWPEALSQLRRHLDARVVTLGHHEFSTGSDVAMCESSDVGTFTEAIAAFSARNPWFLSSEDYVPGRVMTGEDLIGRSDLRRTDFYRGFLQPRGLLHLLCGVVDQQDRGAYCVSIYRAEDQQAFDEREKAELRRLLDHITLSLQSHWRWQAAEELSQALLSLSDHDARPMLLVSGDSETIYRNLAAEHLLESRQGLQLDRTRLVASSNSDRRLLSEAIARLARPGNADSPAVLTMASNPSTPPMVVVVRAVGQVYARQAGARQGLVMVAVRGAQAAHDPSVCAFAQQYALTAAQARVSALVMAGQSLAGISRTLHLSENTVRSHLKQIYHKTDTHGQMELVHLHARVCTALP